MTDTCHVQKQRNEDQRQLPLVTIIVPIRNEAAYIARTLTAILAQDYPPERMQILVVDGMSDDTTRAIVSQFTIYHSLFTIRLLDNPSRIVPTALNIGLAHAAGDVVMRVDGHCEIPFDYVQRCVEGLASGGLACFGGALDTVGETPLAEAIALAMGSFFGVGGSAFRTAASGLHRVDTLAFGAYSREAIQRCGYFDEELVRNQDEEYNYRLRKLGGSLLLDASLRVRYYSRSSLRSLWRQYYRYGYWKVRVLQKHPRQMQWRHFVPPLFVLTLLLGGALGLLNSWLLWLWLGGVALYLVANLTASFLTAARGGWRHFWRLPVIYTLLHVSYGVGFLTGLIRFAHRWHDSHAIGDKIHSSV